MSFAAANSKVSVSRAPLPARLGWPLHKALVTRRGSCIAAQGVKDAVRVNVNIVHVTDVSAKDQMSIHRQFSLVVCAAAVSGMMMMGAPAHAADLALGEQVFNNNCAAAACHQGGRNSVINEKTLDKAALEQYLAGGFKVDSIIYQVTNGKGAMPAWDGTLEEEEIEAVANFVYDKATRSAW